MENLTKAIEELQAITTHKTKGTTNGGLQLARLTIGPHMIIYCSLFGPVVNFQPAGKVVPDEPWSDIRKFSDILNISEDSYFYTLCNKTMMFHYLCYIPVEVIFAGAMGFYLSLGLFPGVQSFTIVGKPFIGIIFSLLGGGLYIYQGYDDWEDGVDNAILDFFIGFTPGSIIVYREYSEPTP